jgi:transcriptional regulator with XRE-family HTH domain
MISNERQYRITKARAKEFEEALRKLNAHSSEDQLWLDIQRDALQGQLEDLRGELQEYRSLQERGIQSVDVVSLEGLPKSLVRARIASGLTQKDLAAQLGLKEQQIQRYEATAYSAASLDRIKEVVTALGLTLSRGVFLPTSRVSLSTFLARSKELGLKDTFIEKRILPKHKDNLGDSAGQAIVLHVAARLERIFNVPTYLLFSDAALNYQSASLAGTRFKLPQNADRKWADAYAVYAHYVALLVLQCSEHLTRRLIPDDPKEIFDDILRVYGDITLRNCIQYVWDLGIPVLPLGDAGGFHGACWRVSGRNIIVLKQVTASTGRWIIDLFHELKHASERPEDHNFSIVENLDLEDSSNLADDELAATDFAVNVALAGNADEIAEECAKEAKGRLQALKSIVPGVAKRRKVRVDILANYLAHRLSEEGQNWWGAAQNLQEEGTDPWKDVRDILVSRIDTSHLNPIDADLFQLAIADRE